MRDGKIDLDFGDGHYEFRLGWKELISLQERTDAGPFFLQQRMLNGDWRVQDISETIRFGLVGAGMTPVEATRLIRLYVERRPLLESLPVAMGIIAAALIGHPEEKPLGEAGGGEAKGSASMTSQTADGASPPSSDSLVPAGSHHARQREAGGDIRRHQRYSGGGRSQSDSRSDGQ